MKAFSDRRDAFERKFAHDEELRFKAIARRNRLLGDWAAEKLGLHGQAADAYARSVVLADFEEVGDADVLNKIVTDFQNSGVSHIEAEVRRVMDELLVQAANDIQSETREP